MQQQQQHPRYLQRSVRRCGDIWRGRYRPTLLPGRGRLMETDMNDLLQQFTMLILQERHTRNSSIAAVKTVASVEKTNTSSLVTDLCGEVASAPAADAHKGLTVESDVAAPVSGASTGNITASGHDAAVGNATSGTAAFACLAEAAACAVGSRASLRQEAAQTATARKATCECDDSSSASSANSSTRAVAGISWSSPQDPADTCSHSSAKLMEEGALELLAWLFARKRFSYIHQKAALEAQEDVWQLLLLVWQALFASPPQPFKEAFKSIDCAVLSSAQSFQVGSSNNSSSNAFNGACAAHSSSKGSTGIGDGQENTNGKEQCCTSSSCYECCDYIFTYRVGCMLLLPLLLYTAPEEEKLHDRVGNESEMLNNAQQHHHSTSNTNSLHSDQQSTVEGPLSGNSYNSTSCTDSRRVAERAETSNNSGTTVNGCTASPAASITEHIRPAHDAQKKESIDIRHARRSALPLNLLLSLKTVELMTQVARMCIKRKELLDGARALQLLWGFKRLRISLFEEAEEACDKRGQPLGINKSCILSAAQREPVIIERPHAANIQSILEEFVEPLVSQLDELVEPSYMRTGQQHLFVDTGRRSKLREDLLESLSVFSRLEQAEPLPWMGDKIIQLPDHL